MTDRLEELAWIELDGELSAEEARELAELRSASADTAAAGGALESEIRRLAAGLSQVEDVDVPPDLTQRILATIDAGRPLVDRSRGSRGEGVAPVAIPTAGRAGRPQWGRWGYLAAGLLIGGLAVYLLIDGKPGSESAPELVGTVAPAPGTGEPPDGGQLTDLPDSFRLTRRGGWLLASLELGGGDSTFVFRAPGFESGGVVFEDGARGSYQAVSGEITIRAAGRGRVEVRLAPARPEQAITFSASGSGFAPFEGEFFLHQLSGS